MKQEKKKWEWLYRILSFGLYDTLTAEYPANNERKKDTQLHSPNNKELVIEDLAARLPYGVRCSYPYGVGTLQSIDLEDMSFTFDCPSDDNYYEIDGIRPYLRPLSSMTDEEREELKKLMNCDYVTYCSLRYTLGGQVDYDDFLVYYEESSKLIDWLNKKMFDHRGLIPKGLADEAPDGMYNN